jgi:D-tyrosyl-tRNA(Tyr) deacylase
MRGVVQRVSKARVLVDGRVTGEIGTGLVVLLGVSKGDTSDAAKYLAEKTATLRIFADDAGKMNRSLLDVSGAALVVSQFTLYGDARGSCQSSTVISSGSVGPASSGARRPTKPTACTKNTALRCAASACPCRPEFFRT